MGHTRPPLDYLLTCSEAGLESFEMSRLNRIANLRRELRDVLDEWMEAEVNARVARWLLECKRAESRAAGAPNLLPPVSLLLGSQALTFLPPMPGADDSPPERNGNAARADGTPRERPPRQPRGSGVSRGDQTRGLRQLERRARRTASLVPAPPIRARLQPALLFQRKLPPAS